MATRLLLSRQLGLAVSQTAARLSRGITSSSKVEEKSKEPAAGFMIPLDTRDQVLSVEQREALEHRPAHITVRENEDVGLVSGVLQEHIKTRTVRIYQPPKNSMQSGTNNVSYWQIDFDTRERWENPLIGWTSTGDPMSNLKVDFASVEDAIEHCEKMGWKYYVQKPNRNEPKPRSYGINFAWNRRTRVSTK